MRAAVDALNRERSAKDSVLQETKWLYAIIFDPDEAKWLSRAGLVLTFWVGLKLCK
jgi:hypothetical protein